MLHWLFEQVRTNLPDIDNVKGHQMNLNLQWKDKKKHGCQWQQTFCNQREFKDKAKGFELFSINVHKWLTFIVKP
jgi:hypothetical protein